MRGHPPGSEEWDALVEALDERISACLAFPFQVPTSDEVLTDPLTGHRVLLSTGRASRPHSAGAPAARSSGPYREGRTPPTLFYVRGVRDDRRPPLVVETETGSLDIIRRRDGARMTAWESVDALGAERTIREHGREEPLVFPREAWSARTFLNVAPITRDPGSGANGFVIAVNPDHEDADLATSPGNLWNALPGEVVEAVVWSWALLESWADRRALLSVPFINGGKDSASGQSLAAFHAQFYAVDPRSAPFLSGRSRETADGVDCPVCALNDTPDLLVARIGSTGVFVHPAPEIEHTLLVAPLDHVSGLGDLSHLADFAEGLRVAVGDLRFIGGRVPPYNVAVRAGRYVDHLHAEVIPRSGVPAAGGFEKATGLFVATREPAAVAAAIRDRFGEDPGGAGPEDAG